MPLVSASDIKAVQWSHLGHLPGGRGADFPLEFQAAPTVPLPLLNTAMQMYTLSKVACDPFLAHGILRM